MVVTRSPTVVCLFFGVLVLLVSENHSLTPHQGVTNNDFQATEVELSLIINQVAVLRLLNESSKSCSLHERELQEMRELKFELDVKAGKLNNDLLKMKNELQSMTAASLDEISRMTEEAKQILKVAVSNVSLQQAAIMTTTPPLECEDNWREYQSSCYKLFEAYITYERAAANCRAHGAYLSSIGSEGENYFVNGLIEGVAIIGLSDEDQEGVYTWQDGSPFSYSKWESGGPYGEHHDCVYMFRDSYWYNYVCSASLPSYICEKRLQ